MKFFTRLWFKFQLSRGNLIPVDNRHRGIGKTTMRVKKSIKGDIPIIVGSQSDINLLKHYDKRVKAYGFAPNYTKQVAGLSFPNGVLIDESVKPEMVDLLKKQYPNAIKIKGGFINYKGDDTR